MIKDFIFNLYNIFSLLALCKFLKKKSHLLILLCCPYIVIDLELPVCACIFVFVFLFVF